MKKLRYIISLIMTTAMLGHFGCNSDDPSPMAPDLQAEVLAALQNGGASWVLGSTGSVTKDDYDVTDQYAGFSLFVGEFTYTVENSTGTAWPNSSGPWQFANDTGTLVTRDGDTDINVEVNGTSLTLTFMVSESNESGRLSSVSGEYEFVLESE